MEDDTIFGEIGKTEMEGVDPTVPPAEKETPETTPEQGGSKLENVPFHQHPRWKEVYSKAQRVDELEKTVADLNARMGKGQPQDPEDEWQPKTWSEVKQKILQDAVKQVFGEMQRMQEESTSQVQAEDKALEDALVTLKSEKGEFDQKRLLETAWKYQVSDLSKAYDIMQMEGEAEKRGESRALRKKAAPIGSSKKTEGGAKATTSYKAFKSTTLDDIVADAAEKISG